MSRECRIGGRRRGVALIMVLASLTILTTAFAEGKARNRALGIWGAMGGAVANDGSMEMQCQSCHGTMSQVGAAINPGAYTSPWSIMASATFTKPAMFALTT